MAGIYIHIPFCLQRCSYCDFYSSTSISLLEQYIEVLEIEIRQRSDYLQENIETIYFGGGTPSVLTSSQITFILEKVFNTFKVNTDAEITLEANPEDLSEHYLKELSTTKVNRLSIGIQSFDDNMLRFMNRRHDSKQAIKAVENAYRFGIENISTDLIYGLPGLSDEQWKVSLIKMFELPITHLSAYHLTYHANTKLFKLLKAGSINEISDELSIKHFNTLIDEANKNDFEHYEISNFAKSGFYSKHNTAYWKQIPYLGLGPSAHSFNLDRREWNKSSLKSYVSVLRNNAFERESEQLSMKDKYNDYIITSLRTKWGVDLNYVLTTFGDSFVQQLEKNIQKHKNMLIIDKNSIRISKDGLLISDGIMTDFIIA